VAGCEVRRDLNTAGVERLSVFQDLYSRRNTIHWFDDAELWIGPKHLALPKYFRRPRTRRHAGAAQMLNFRDPARVVVMGVRVENQLNVFDPEAEFLDVFRDLRYGFREGRVDEDVAGFRSNQNRAESMRTDEVRVAIDPEWFLRCIPDFPLLSEKADCNRYAQEGARPHDYALTTSE
jgi:hypothetical protein